MNLEIALRRDNEVTILDLSGRMRAGADIVKFRQALKALVGEGRLAVVANLEKIGRIDSSGLGELIAGFVTLEKNGGKLKLLNLNESVVELMVMTKLLTVFEVFEDEGEAVRSFGLNITKADAVSVAAAAGDSFGDEPEGRPAGDQV
ncbi:MAG: STAS domain-containing protein [Acidobacteriota bacterium]|nr:MAG: STAS domain-containing protein [Acidobacteriota bacterium]